MPTPDRNEEARRLASFIADLLPQFDPEIIAVDTNHDAPGLIVTMQSNNRYTVTITPAT